MPPLREVLEQSLPWHMVGHVLTMFLIPMPLGWMMAQRIHRFPPPWFAVGSLNVVMIVSHVPRIFDAVMNAGTVATELQSFVFFAAGVNFFALVFHPSTPLRWSAGGVIFTMAVMLGLAMSMSIFTSSAWYESVGEMPGMVMDGDFAAQQLAAAILWICGDIWAVPVLVWLLRVRISREGSLLAMLDRYSAPRSVR
jgi:cytochrome c oxidase assembly factor CtaG